MIATPNVFYINCTGCSITVGFTTTYINDKPAKKDLIQIPKQKQERPAWKSKWPESKGRR